MRISIASVACCFTTFFLVNPVAAQVKRDLDSHEHGASNLNIVIDNNTVYLEFETPWNNLVGFEHAPSTDEQQEAVSQAMALLEEPLTLFIPAGDADCVAKSIDIDSTMSAEGSHSEHEHEEEHAEHEDEHDHEEEHAEHEDEHDHEEEHAEHKDEHDHEEEHAEHDSETHSEVLAQYSYECDNVSELASIDAQLFQYWSGLDHIEVQMAGPAGQSATEVNASNTVINLAAIR